MPPAPPTATDPVPPRRVLPVIVLAQLLGTSPWFAVNAVMPDLERAHGWGAAAVGTLSAALQLGFVAGTLLFALLAVSDRFAARRVFLACALAAAACTLAAVAAASSLPALVALRALTGFFLAGIYPVGMKIAAQWFPRGLGFALGWLVGALVLGSASPHALRALSAEGGGLAAGAGAAGGDWQLVLIAVAALAATAGAAVITLVPEPPGAPRGAALPALRLAALAELWRNPRVRASAGGYFGHMWELYTMWVLVPVVLAARLADSVAVSWASFLVLGAGALGCIGGGLLVHRVGGARVAGAQLATSGLCCLAAPWMLTAPIPVFMAWLLLWGITVAGDSPQFSALTASNAPREAVGSLLTLVNSIGFAISAVSIELFVRLAATQPLAELLPWLAVGPLIGLVMLRPLLALQRAP
ncbi:MAG: MFS transporter [Pseudomonadota bacterium]|jgi:DHA1 family inner membrane transport protein|nr:MFS transporter [Rubrivivax sp.]MCA3258128.1 MFS transporter [Rubrivivax sp.]MCE2912288.1 MFS transporter [Rubrivivax sp.]MCZ8031447.1 MFS transporter [Rubrivivax sp.]